MIFLLLLIPCIVGTSLRNVFLIDVCSDSKQDIENVKEGMYRSFDSYLFNRAEMNVSVFQHDKWLLTWTSVLDRETIKLAISNIAYQPRDSCNWTLATNTVANRLDSKNYETYVLTNEEKIEKKSGFIPVTIRGKSRNADGIVLESFLKLPSLFDPMYRTLGTVTYTSQPTELVTLAPTSATVAATAGAAQFAKVIAHIYLKDNSVDRGAPQRVSVARGYAGIPVIITDSLGEEHTSISNTRGDILFDNVSLGNAQIKVLIPPGFVPRNTFITSYVIRNTINQIPSFEMSFNERHLQKSSIGDSGWTTADIVVTVLVGFLALVALIFFFYLLYNRQKRITAQSSYEPMQEMIKAPISSKAVIFGHGLKKAQ